MPTAVSKTSGAEDRGPLSAEPKSDAAKARAGMWIGWGGLLFAVLQSVCTFFAAMSGLRVGIGIGSLVLAGSTVGVIKSLHVDWLRVPMVLLAVIGSVLNLVVLWQIRRLRKSPAAQWRVRTVSAGRMRMERVQLLLSIVTLVLVFLEERQHWIWHQHL